MCVLFVVVGHGAGACGFKGLGSRELELKEIVSQFMWVLGPELLSSARAVEQLSRAVTL